MQFIPGYIHLGIIQLYKIFPLNMAYNYTRNLICVRQWRIQIDEKIDYSDFDLGNNFKLQYVSIWK